LFYTLCYKSDKIMAIITIIYESNIKLVMLGDNIMVNAKDETQDIIFTEEAIEKLIKEYKKIKK